jgi:type VI protein secretion system component VasF
MSRKNLPLWPALAIFVALTVLAYLFRIPTWEVTPSMCQNMQSRYMTPAQLKKCGELLP